MVHAPIRRRNGVELWTLALWYAEWGRTEAKNKWGNTIETEQNVAAKKMRPVIWTSKQVRKPEVGSKGCSAVGNFGVLSLPRRQ